MAIQRSDQLPLPRFHRTGRFPNQVLAGVPVDGKPTLGPHSFDSSKIDRQYARALVEYAARFMRGPEPKPIEPTSCDGDTRVTVGDYALGRAVWDVLLGGLTRSEEPGSNDPLGEQRQHARERIRYELGYRHDLDRKIMSHLRKSYPDDHLDDCHVVYNGHTTGATIALFPMLRDRGLQSGGVRRAPYSGDKGAAPLINTILSELMRAKGKDFNLAGEPPEKIWDELRKPGIVILLNGATMIKGAMAAQNLTALPDDIRQRIEEGKIRFVLHNAADLAAFESLKLRQAVALDLARSQPKEMETKVIGQQLVQHGEEASRRLNCTRLQDSKVIVMGHGMIGRAITKALEDQRVPKQNIFVIDINPDQDAPANKLGHLRAGHCGPELPDLSEHENGVLFVATASAKGLEAGQLTRLPRNMVVINANSGGEGVNIDAIMGRVDETGKRVGGPYGNGQRFDHFEGAHGVRPGENPVFSDMVATRRPEDPEGIPECFSLVNVAEMWVPDPNDSKMRIRQVRAFAPNLTDTLGQEYLDTSAMLAVATCIIKGLREPRSVPYAFPDDEAQAIYMASLRPLNDDCLM